MRNRQHRRQFMYFFAYFFLFSVHKFQTCERINRNEHFGMHFICLNRVRGPHLSTLWILEAVLEHRLSLCSSDYCVQVLFLRNKIINNTRLLQPKVFYFCFRIKLIYLHGKPFVVCSLHV